MLGWVRNLIGFYEARELVEFDRFTNAGAWLERGLARPGGPTRAQDPGGLIRRDAGAPGPTRTDTPCRTRF